MKIGQGLQSGGRALLNVRWLCCHCCRWCLWLLALSINRSHAVSAEWELAKLVITSIQAVSVINVIDTGVCHGG
jgi:hypothetical protein